MYPKYFRFIFRDFYCRQIVYAFLFIAVILIAEGYILHGQKKQLAKVSKEKAMVDKIGEWEAVLQHGLSAVKADGPAEIVFQGTGIRNNNIHAIINGQVYTVGSPVGPYVVTEISSGRVLLKNSQTNEVKELIFKEPTAAELQKNLPVQ